MTYLAITIWVACGLLELTNGQNDMINSTAACKNATSTLLNNTECGEPLTNNSTDNATRIMTICRAPCRNLFDNVLRLINCSGLIEGIATDVETLNRLCSCEVATNNLSSNNNCKTAIRDNNTTTICSETCMSLFKPLLTCPLNRWNITQATIDNVCATGGTDATTSGTDGTSGTGTIKGLGVIGLLLITATVSWVD